MDPKSKIKPEDGKTSKYFESAGPPRKPLSRLSLKRKRYQDATCAVDAPSRTENASDEQPKEDSTVAMVTSGEDMQPQGGEDVSSPYYLENFTLVLDSVLSDDFYLHLFNEEDLRTVEEFRALQGGCETCTFHLMNYSHSVS
jgi:hypothetical protein